MQENKFERQVREEMEEFRIRPSASVWDRVEDELHRKKRRRILVYWLLIIGIGLGSLATYKLTTSAPQAPVAAHQQNDKNAGPATQSSNQPALPAAQPATGKNAASPITPAPSAQPGKEMVTASTDILPAPGHTGKVIARQNQAIAARQPAAGRPVTDKGISVTTRAAGTQRAGKVPDEITPSAALPAVNQETAQQENTKQQQGFDTGETVVRTADAGKNENTDSNTPANAEHDAQASATDPAITMQEVAESAVIKIPSRRRRIEWGVETGFGYGKRMDQTFPTIIEAQKDANLNNVPQYGSATGNGGIPAPRPLLLPSNSNWSAGFKLGVYAKIPISKRSNLVAGLRYAYRSDKIQVGGSLDTFLASNPSTTSFSGASRAYQVDNHHDFINKYHFVQIPLQWQWQINKGRVLPISWEIGLTPGLLMNTTAMVYDTAYYGIYYRDKKAFSKFQLHAETGFSFHLGNKSRWRWAIGPEASFSLTALSRNAFDPRQYLMYGGLRAQVILPSRKNKR